MEDLEKTNLIYKYLDTNNIIEEDGTRKEIDSRKEMNSSVDGISKKEISNNVKEISNNLKEGNDINSMDLLNSDINEKLNIDIYNKEIKINRTSINIIDDNITRNRTDTIETLNTTSRNNKSNSLTSYINTPSNYLNVNNLTSHTLKNLTLHSPQLSYISNVSSPLPVYSKSSLLSPLPIYSNVSETRMGSIDLTGQHHSLIDRNCDGLSRSFIDNNDDNDTENEDENSELDYDDTNMNEYHLDVNLQENYEELDDEPTDNEATEEELTEESEDEEDALSLKLVRIRVNSSSVLLRKEIETPLKVKPLIKVPSIASFKNEDSPHSQASEVTLWPSSNHFSLAPLQDPASISCSSAFVDPKLSSFHLPIIFESGFTGYEPSTNFPVTKNSVIANRYVILGKVGSAAFSDALSCLDKFTNNNVCVKVIKKHSDFFMGLDEIKILRLLQNEDPNNHYIVQLLDYFFYKEHIFLVSELLKYNLYEYKKMFRHEEEDYFNMDRLKKIAKQVLHALSYIHSLDLVHSDLKPENILLKSCSQCEVRVIDFGSSCFVGEELSYYVQSRSYRAPEVILGVTYDTKIDVWSLGCIMAEAFSGVVLFPNNSVNVLLARIQSILGPFSEEFLSRGIYSHKYFTRDNLVFEYDDGEIFLLYGEKSDLKKVLNCDDELFIDFLSKLLTIDPLHRPSANEALKHPWLNYV